MGICSSNKTFTIIKTQQAIQQPGLIFTVIDSNPYADVFKYYEFVQTIGQGNFGTVHKAFRINSTPQRYVAIKSIPKARVSNDIKLLKNEIESISVLEHPNVVKFYEAYEDDTYIHIVMELCQGLDLLEQILKNGSQTEAQACIIMEKLFKAVNYLHEMHICHRDLKPENLLFEHGGLDAEIKVTDFGLSRKFGDDSLHTVVGTPYYVAPEVLKKQYGKECDIWSLGVIMFVILSGSPPFRGGSPNKVFRRIIRRKFSYKAPCWEDISVEAKDLIDKLLCIKPWQRLSVQEALSHPWFIRFKTQQIQQVPLQIISKLKNTRAPKKLKEVFLKVVVNNLNANEITSLRVRVNQQAFMMLDTEHTGFITASQLKHLIQQSDFRIPVQDLQKIAKSITTHGNRKLDYSQFLMATLNLKEVIDDKKLHEAFSYFDTDNTGHITKNKLHQALQRAGAFVPEADVELMMNELDFSMNANLSYGDFRSIVLGSANLSGAYSPLNMVQPDGTIRKCTSISLRTKDGNSLSSLSFVSRV